MSKQLLFKLTDTEHARFEAVVAALYPHVGRGGKKGAFLTGLDLLERFAWGDLQNVESPDPATAGIFAGKAEAKNS